MKYLAFSVRDSKADAFLLPFFCQTVGLAERSFCMAVNDVDHDFHKFAEDYSLFKIGSFDAETGSFVADEQVTQVMTALTAIRLNGGDDA